MISELSTVRRLILTVCITSLAASQTPIARQAPDLRTLVSKSRNPWGTAPVALTRNGKRWQQLQGPLLTFDTETGDVIEVRIAAAGARESLQ
jgi:hypothetical protein